jgi:hypothetical protein
MAFWFGKKKKTELREVALPGDVGTISFPADFLIDMEDETTLRAQPKEDDAIIFRVSSISCTKKGDYTEAMGKDTMRRQANEKGLPFWEIDDKGILSYESPSEHEGEPLLMKYWHIGSKSTIVVLSATITVSKQDSQLVQQALGLIPRILESLKITKVRHIVVDGDREVETVATEVELIPQKVVPFGPTENAWREESLELARAMGIKYGSGGDLTPEELDVVFSRWVHEEGEKEADDLVADALGAAFGQHFVEQHGFRWVVLTDQYGTDYAVRHSIGESTAFPKASVQKRIEDKCPEFFQNVYLIVLDQLKRSQKEGKAP